MLPAEPPITKASEEPAGRLEAPCNQAAPASAEPEPLVLTSPRELQYVFEVSAEEASMRDSRASEEAEDDFVLNEDDLRPPEAVEDDAFAYEVRPRALAGGGSSHATKETSATSNQNLQSRGKEI